MKDFDEPVALFQLGDGRFPPLKTISNTNLPRPASSFVGRARERDELLALLRNGSRLVTLSGPGGSGKTRLALEVASELVPDLQGRRLLGRPVRAARPDARDANDRTDAGGEGRPRRARLRARALAAARQLRAGGRGGARALAAARGLPQPEAPGHEPGAAADQRRGRVPGAAARGARGGRALLRARRDSSPTRRSPSSAAGSTTCRSQSSSPPPAPASSLPAQILDRLGQRLDLLKGGRDADPRQQTLRATIEWSHELLTEDEQQLFARLAVFAGGCTLDAAEDVCDADLDVLQSLVEKSLLRHTGDRFWMLETIREFAAERLQDQLEAGRIFERHAQWYLRLATSAQGELRGAAAAEWLGRLNADLENLRRAIGWARDHDERLEVELVGADLVLPLHARTPSRGAGLPRARARNSPVDLARSERSFCTGRDPWPSKRAITRPRNSGTSNSSSSDAPAETLG